MHGAAHVQHDRICYTQCIIIVVMYMQAMCNMQKLKVQLTGVLTHGRGAYVFWQYNQFSCDSNQTVTVLLRCLEELSPLPETLYLQMDNCTGQNKNKFVLSFLYYLVQTKVFRKVYILSLLA